MAAERLHDRVRGLFDRLVELPETARGEALADARRADADAADRAERLLRAHEWGAAGAGGALDPVFVFEEAGPSEKAETPLLRDGEVLRTPIGEVVVAERLSGAAGPRRAEVYRCRHADAGWVALKLLRDAGTAREVRRRFLGEAAALRSLDHPHVARLLGAGAIEREGAASCVGILTRFVEGRALDEWARGRSAAEVVRAVEQIARALHHVHLRQILHRDIKPSNIVVGPDGRAVLLDLGVAKFMGERQDEFASLGRTVAGTLHYMAPEQLTPTTTPVDVRADVYALGVVLYELLSGRALVELEGLSEAEALRRKLGARAAVPGGTGVVGLALLAAASACSADAGQRYESAEKFADDLVRAVEGRPLSIRPIGRARRAWMFARRHPVPVVAGAVVALSLTAGALSNWRAQHRVAAAQARAEARFDDTRSFARWVIVDLADRLAFVPDTSGARRELVEQAAGTLARLAADPVAGPGLILELAESHTRLGEMLEEELGDLPAAMGSYRAALALTDRHPDQTDPSVRMLRGWIACKRLFAVDEIALPENEVPVLERTLTVFDEIGAALDGNADAHRRQSRVRFHYSRRQLEMGVPTAVIEASLREAVRHADRAAALAPRSAIAMAEPAQSRFWLARALLDRSDTGAAEAIAEAVSSAERLAAGAHPLGRMHLSRALLLRAELLAQRGLMAEFTETARKAVAVSDLSRAWDPNNKLTVRDAEVTRIRLARSAFEANTAFGDGPLEDARAWADEALVMFRARVARGWTYDYEDAVYPPSYGALLQALEEAVRAGSPVEP